jgi:hypothetical protein
VDGETYDWLAAQGVSVSGTLRDMIVRARREADEAIAGPEKSLAGGRARTHQTSLSPAIAGPEKSLAGGRARTHQTSLSPAQDAWVRSRPEGASAYLRGLVERDRTTASQIKREISSSTVPTSVSPTARES